MAKGVGGQSGHGSCEVVEFDAEELLPHKDEVAAVELLLLPELDPGPVGGVEVDEAVGAIFTRVELRVAPRHEFVAREDDVALLPAEDGAALRDAVDVLNHASDADLEETLAAGARKESGPSMYDELVQDAEQTLMESRFERNEDSDCEFVSPIQTLEQAQQAKVGTRKMRDLQMATILTAEALKKEGSRPTNFNFHTNSIECLFVMQRKSQKKKSRRRKYLMRFLPLPQNPMFLASSVGRSAIQAGVRIS